jgi:hypothetical protein
MLRVWHKVISDVVRDGGQLLSIIPRFESLEPVPHLSGCSRLISKRRALCGTVGVLVGIYLNSTAALAEVEEVTPDLGGSSNSISTLPSGLEIELLTDGYDDISDKDISKFRLDDNLIPATVWSLHGNNVTHLDRIQDGLESQIYTGSGAHFESPYSWIRTATALWSGNSTYTPGDLLLLPPPQFQVASCGGSHAERRDLDYCSKGNIVVSEETDPTSSSETSVSGDNTVQNTSNGITSARDISSSSANTQSTSFSSMPAFISNPLSYGDLTLLGPCGGVSASCTIINIDPPEVPVDSLAPGSPTSPVPSPDVTSPDITTPNPITHVDDPGLGSDLPLVFTPQPLKPIPEAPTWVMTITGFGIMVFVFRKKRRPRINSISIIDEVY